MPVHVGIYPIIGNLSYYNESKKETVDLSIKAVPENAIKKVASMFDKIKSKINEEFGYACIYLYQGYGNEIRKEFIECGLKIGFKNVETINYEIVVYLNAMSQSNYKPLNGNVIWIQEGRSDFYVWKIKDQKAKFVGHWEVDPSKLSDLQKILNESKLNKGPDVVLHDDNVNKKIFNEISNCQFFSYNHTDYFRSRACLLKTRITAGDSNLICLQTESFLSQSISLKIGKKEIVSFEICETLPKIFSQKLIKESGDVFLTVDKKGWEENVFELPNYDEIYLTFKINMNEIYFVSFSPDGWTEDEKSFIDFLSSFHVPSSSSLVNVFTIPKIKMPYNASKTAIGIDLGTTRCCVSVIRLNGIQTVALENTGGRLLPSYVSYNGENVKCGQIVVDRLRYFSKSTIFDSKRLIGRNLSEIEIDSFWPFSLLETDGKLFLEVEKQNGQRYVTAEEVASELLKYMKAKTEVFQGTKLSKAVITVPAAFSEAQNEATMKAAKMAGWEEITLLPEPIAAAFAYFNDRPIPNDSNILLFDLGGGTLDVCIFKIQNDQIKIISNTGDTKFGGRDFDTVLINYFKNALITKYGISLTDSKKYLLMAKSQQIKETLSVEATTDLDVDDFDLTQEDKFFSTTRENFQKMCDPLLNRIKNTISASLNNSKLEANQVQKVLLVGGGSRMPMIKDLLRNMFPEAEHCIEEHPEEVVAIGASYYAYTVF